MLCFIHMNIKLMTVPRTAPTNALPGLITQILGLTTSLLTGLAGLLVHGGQAFHWFQMEDLIAMQLEGFSSSFSPSTKVSKNQVTVSGHSTNEPFVSLSVLSDP